MKLLGINNLKINAKVNILVRSFDDSHVCSFLSLTVYIGSKVGYANAHH